jgi:hypothetical protein
MRCGQNLEAWEPDDVREGDDIVEPANDTNEKCEEIWEVSKGRKQYQNEIKKSEVKYLEKVEGGV